MSLIAALSAVFAGATFGYRDIPPQVAAHVTPQEAHLTLPAGATDVCIERGYRGTISYNFAIDEAGFWEWAKSNAESIESEASGVQIMRVNGSFEIYDSFAQTTGIQLPVDGTTTFMSKTAHTNMPTRGSRPRVLLISRVLSERQTLLSKLLIVACYDVAPEVSKPKAKFRRVRRSEATMLGVELAADHA